MHSFLFHENASTTPKEHPLSASIPLSWPEPKGEEHLACQACQAIAVLDTAFLKHSRQFPLPTLLYLRRVILDTVRKRATIS